MQHGHAVDPSTLAALTPGRGFDLRFRRYKTSVRTHGSHTMVLRQPSRIPESSREFAPGDPITLIDWKAFARTDQLIIREVRDEASAKAAVVLDASETMNWPDAGVPDPKGGVKPVTKLEVATRVAFDLAHAHLRAGDLVAIWLLEEGKEPKQCFLPRSPSDLLAAFQRIARARFARDEIVAEFKPPRSAQTAKASDADVGWWVGDALGRGGFISFLSRVRAGGMVHVLSSMEMDVSWIDLETSYFDEGLERREYQGQVLLTRDGYRKSLEKWRRRLERRARRLGREFLTVTDKTQVATYQAYLTQAVRAG